MEGKLQLLYYCPMNPQHPMALKRLTGLGPINFPIGFRNFPNLKIQGGSYVIYLVLLLDLLPEALTHTD